jgi:two-component system, NtrC family, sensor kinase
MRRRSRAGGEPAKARRRKAVAVKRGNAPKSARGRSSSATGRETEITRLTRELNESLERQAATADVLNVISRSTFDLAKVLNTLLESAARLSEADKGVILRPTGKDASYYVAASYRHTPEFKEHQTHLTFAPGRSGAVSRVLLEGKSVQIPDVLADPEYKLREIARLGDFRTILGVPLFREGIPIGVLLLQRAVVRPFNEKQIKLVETFADQAVIAIENARLFQAEQQRTRELTESLERQTATSEVLQVINNSPGDLQPVFEAMLESAVRLCDAKFGNIYRWDGELMHLLAAHNTPPALAEARRQSAFRPSSIVRQMVETKEAAQAVDLAADKSYTDEPNPAALAAVELGGVRTFLSVPMVRENELIGSFSLYRQEVRPFTEKQIELVQNFAAQAVIAIENTRLLNELRERTDDLTERTADLTEALEQRTATSEVLQVISSSAGDLEPVFETMLGNAARICDAKFGNIFRWDGDALRLVATHNTPPAFAEYRKRRPLPLKPNLPFSRIVAAKAVVRCADAAALPAYTEQRDPDIVAAVELGGIRTFVAVPMLKENKLIGALIVYRQEVRPFTDKQIELVENFANQAVIAIENARLLTELRQRTTDLTESLEQQTVTSEVLGVISRSKFELQPILQSVVDTAARLCRAEQAVIFRLEDGIYCFAAGHSVDPAYLEIERQTPIPPGPGTAVGRAAMNRKVARIDDA